MEFRKVIAAAVVLAGLMSLFGCAAEKAGSDLYDNTGFTPEEQLGETLFFETALSPDPGMACANCHRPEVAFADPETGLPVSRGVHVGRFGNRNDQPVTYALYAPPLHFDEAEEIWVGGLFWDGRVNTLEEQSQGPPLNPLEMANTDTLSIADRLRALPYADRFEAIYGPFALDDDHTAYENMARAMAAFERTKPFRRFDSKYDLYLAGEVDLSAQELRGMDLFVDEKKGNCAACHPHTAAEDGTPPLFTDFTYDNLGVPKNPALPFYTLPPSLNPDGAEWVDRGLGVTLDDPAWDGFFRVPSLRNIALTPPYMHNGVFNTLFEVVAFYNSRDVGPWPEPEIARGVNKDELGDLGLSNTEMDDIVAFMLTLTDGYDPHEEAEDD